jgi:hypothetical protein
MKLHTQAAECLVWSRADVFRLAGDMATANRERTGSLVKQDGVDRVDSVSLRQKWQKFLVGRTRDVMISI